MLYVQYSKEGDVINFVDGNYPGKEYNTVRHTVSDYGTAERIAKRVSELSGEQYIATDNGEWVSPRFDVVRAPQVGDKVSYGFNGDYYPSGEITKISASFRRIVTSEGKVFYRKKLRASWINCGTWGLVQGHIDERNPHF